MRSCQRANLLRLTRHLDVGTSKKITYLFCLDQDGLLHADASMAAHDEVFHCIWQVLFSGLLIPQMVRY